MSISDDIDKMLDQLIEAKDEDGVDIDVDLDITRDMAEQTAMVNQVTMADHFRQMKLANQCPNCGTEMGDGMRYILRVKESAWDVCDMGCAVSMFRRQYPNPKNITSSIEVYDPRRRKLL